MEKTFRSSDVDEVWLLAPSVQEFVPEGHVAHFIRDTVRETLDLGAILWLQLRTAHGLLKPAAARA